MKTADGRRLYIRALAVVHLHDLREMLGTDAEQLELDRAVLGHAMKMLQNTARKCGLSRAISYDTMREDARMILLEAKRFSFAALAGR